MADVTLPGDIPGLLRRGSPVHVAGLARGCDAVVVSVSTRSAVIGFTTNENLSDLALDLSDPTGRAHAAWFVLHPTWNEPIHTLPSWVSRRQFAELMAHAIEGRDMEPHRVDLLRRIVLHVAGREESND